MEHESADGRVATEGPSTITIGRVQRYGVRVWKARTRSRTKRRRSRRKSSGWVWWEREVAKRHSKRTIQRHPTVTNAWRPYLTWCYRTFPYVTLTDRPRSRRTSIFGHFGSFYSSVGLADIDRANGEFGQDIFFLSLKFVKIIKRVWT